LYDGFLDVVVNLWLGNRLVVGGNVDIVVDVGRYMSIRKKEGRGVGDLYVEGNVTDESL
jgi:hypothetical protein